MKSGLLYLLITCLSLASFSQSIDAGRRFYYYQRYTSAFNEFQKSVDADPNNFEAIYWLGQTMLQVKDSASANVLYKKTLSANGNNPLLLAGLAQTELMNRQIDSARKHFELALAIADGKDVEVFHAVARANIEAQAGDANYAIETINAIPDHRRKAHKNAESYLLIGEAYRKLINGGGAVTALNQALSMDPRLAEAKYQIGKVYLTQNNPEIFLPAFEEAVHIDPKYAPALYELFYYWFERDINKARAYFENYLSASDRDPSTEYDKVSIIYASRNFQEAIDSAKSRIALRGELADPRYYKLIAYSYDELKDSVQAKEYLNQYFSKQKPGDFLAQDYVFRARLMGRFPGNADAVSSNYEKAIALDTSKAGKEKIMTDAVEFAAKSGDFPMEAEWLGRVYRSATDPSNRDLYNWGYAHYKAGNFVTADSIFCNVYTRNYPDEIFGYLWCARAAGAQDTSMEKGTAIEPYKRLIAFARASGEREDYKATLIQAHGYLASYYANIAKDKDSAVAYLQNILKLDPDNESAGRYIEILTKPAPEPSSKNAGNTKSPAKKTAVKKRRAS